MIKISSTNKIILFAVALATIIGALIYFNPPHNDVPASRAQIFRVSSGNKDGPQFMDGIIDPFRPLPDETQKFSIKVSDSVEVVKVEAVVKTDNKSRFYALKLNTSSGYWEGAWKIDDTINSNYAIAVTATNSNQKTSLVEITLK